MLFFSEGVVSMELHTEYKSGSLCIHLSGELDHHSAALTFMRIEAALDRYLPRSCTLEMSGLGFMDSSGIAVVLRTQKRMRETGGKFCVLDPSPISARVLSASGIDRLVPIKIREGRIAR